MSTSDTLSFIADMAAHVSDSGTSSNVGGTKNKEITGKRQTIGQTATFERLSQREKEHELLMQRELRNLQFENPGENAVLADFSQRRRPRRKVFEDNQKKRTAIKGPHHNERGALNVNGQLHFLCDCLRSECHGCHWPCRSCGSRRCGPACQIDRDYTYSEVIESSIGGRCSNPFI